MKCEICPRWNLPSALAIRLTAVIRYFFWYSHLLMTKLNHMLLSVDNYILCQKHCGHLDEVSWLDSSNYQLK